MVRQLRSYDYAGVRRARERAEGADKRKQFAALFDDAAKRKFDLVLFWALDQFSREGMAQTIAHLQRLTSYGVSFHSYTEPHLATDNELVRNILLALLSSLAKVEAQKISDRTKAGMARAKAKGIKVGRPRLTIELRQQIAGRAAKGEKPYAIAKALRIDRHTAAKYAGWATAITSRAPTALRRMPFASACFRQRSCSLILSAQTQMAIGSPVASGGLSPDKQRALPFAKRPADQPATTTSGVSSIGSPWSRPDFSIASSLGKSRVSARTPFVASSNQVYGRPWASQLARGSKLRDVLRAPPCAIPNVTGEARQLPLSCSKYSKPAW